MLTLPRDDRKRRHPNCRKVHPHTASTTYIPLGRVKTRKKSRNPHICRFYSRKVVEMWGFCREPAILAEKQGFFCKSCKYGQNKKYVEGRETRIPTYPLPSLLSRRYHPPPTSKKHTEGCRFAPCPNNREEDTGYRLSPRPHTPPAGPAVHDHTTYIHTHI